MRGHTYLDSSATRLSITVGWLLRERVAWTADACLSALHSSPRADCQRIHLAHHLPPSHTKVVAAMPQSHTGASLQPDLERLKGITRTDFGKRLYNRQYALLVSELFALREALIGSDALVAMIKAGKGPEDLSKAIISYKTSSDLAAFWRTLYYVQDAAYGDCCLRMVGLLPQVAEVPIVPFVTALEAEPVDWQKLWYYVERERSRGKLKGTKAWAGTEEAVRAKLQRTLDELNENYSESSCMLATSYTCLRPLTSLPVELVKLGSDDLCGEEDALARLSDGAIDMGISQAGLEPLTNAAWITATCPYSVEHLEELQARGQAVRRWLASTCREVGNHHYQEAGRLRGAEQEAAWAKARNSWRSATSDPEQAGGLGATQLSWS